MSGYPNFLDDDEDVARQPEQPDLDTTLRTLKENVEGTANATIFYGLSGLSGEDVVRVRDVWSQLGAENRHKLLQQLVDVSEANFELDYRPFALMALEDSDNAVRTAAIDLLWEDETLEVLNRLIDLAQWDESTPVRASAAGALGRFILLGELGDLPASETIRAQDVVVSLYNDVAEDVDVRRRALEAIANCGHEIVDEAIEEAFASEEPLMQASAVFAMGRTCDNRWNEAVLRSFEHSDPAIRYEAAVPVASSKSRKLCHILRAWRRVVIGKSRKWQFGHWVRSAAATP